MNTLPRLSSTFWAYLDRLTSELDRLIELLEEERISLLKRQFSRIHFYAREKEELAKKIKNSEDRLIVTIRQILIKAGINPEYSSTFNELKNCLEFQDLIRFEKWLANYRLKKAEAHAKNARNLNWAKEGLALATELSKIIMGLCKDKTLRGARDYKLYNSTGRIKEG